MDESDLPEHWRNVSSLAKEHELGYGVSQLENGQQMVYMMRECVPSGFELPPVPKVLKFIQIVSPKPGAPRSSWQLNGLAYHVGHLRHVMEKEYRATLQQHNEEGAPYDQIPALRTIQEAVENEIEHHRQSLNKPVQGACKVFAAFLYLVKKNVDEAFDKFPDEARQTTYGEKALLLRHQARQRERPTVPQPLWVWRRLEETYTPAEILQHESISLWGKIRVARSTALDRLEVLSEYLGVDQLVYEATQEGLQVQLEKISGVVDTLAHLNCKRGVYEMLLSHALFGKKPPQWEDVEEVISDSEQVERVGVSHTYVKRMAAGLAEERNEEDEYMRLENPNLLNGATEVKKWLGELAKPEDPIAPGTVLGHLKKPHIDLWQNTKQNKKFDNAEFARIFDEIIEYGSRWPPFSE